MLYGIANAPMRVTARNATAHSGPVGMWIPTRVPFPTPAASSSLARRRDARSASRNEIRRSSITT